MQVLWLLLAGLSCHGVGGFMMHLVTECPVAGNGAVLAVDVYLAFNKNRLVCYDPNSRLFYGCDPGLLQNASNHIASALNMNRTFIHLAASKQQGCQDQIQGLWAQTALRRRPPQVRVAALPMQSRLAPTRLACFVWDFYPASVQVSWLHNGHPLDTNETGPVATVPHGDWTYQTTQILPVHLKPGDAYTCEVKHASLSEPLLRHWSPGPSDQLLWGSAAAGLVLGLLVFAAGTSCWWRAPVRHGYTPLAGDNYPRGNI
ncbi:HLA class II histocompatibility antigen, DM beta chain [Alligator sinensis]|uniref:HLA class II histocompatibility antigen, DM beta chain n=1 Tax=Alligator sinensis TaxID=38654 RepID=A0A1U7SMT9_ALLSI|nr:HLA class II histocompatibility antigen, DM beta chain [Alligator sinensis]